jgi:high-affinity K+ transport system ATPase subunit B
MKQMIFAATLLVAMLATTIAEAHGRYNNTQQKQRSQHHRIQQGVRSGQLTHMEARQLRNQQAKVVHYKRMAMADGRITRDEHILINRAQHQAGKNIYHQKHDGQRRHRRY